MPDSQRCAYFKEKEHWRWVSCWKKSPLVVPPDFDKLPTPINKDDNISSQDEPASGLNSNIKKKFSTKPKNNSNNQTIETTILEKIK